MSANTEILIKRSLANSAPSSLLQGELAFSYASNTLFIGTPGSDGAFEIAGYRDYSANFVSGAGQYGSSTQVPIITVAANGQITAINTASISTTLGINADSGGPSSVDLLSQNLDIAGGVGITSSVSGQTITLDVDDTVVRSNTAMQYQLIDGDVEISGNLVVTGNTTTVNVSTLNIADPLIYLASNNYSSDIVDIGFVGNYFDGSTQRHAGFYRHAGDKQFYVFDNYDQEPDNNLINPTDASFRLGTINANLTANTANVNQTLTLGSSSQLFANGGAYFGGTPYFYGGASFEDSLVLNSSNRFQLKNADNTATIDIYNNGGTNANQLYVDSSETQFTGNVVVSGTLKAGLTKATSGNIVFFNAATNEITYGADDILTPTSIANGSYSLGISGTDGMLTTNGAGLTLSNGAILKDTSGNSIALGKFAGTLSQGTESIAIGDSAGYNTQGTNAVALGYGAGNVSQGNYGIAIGTNAGETSQGGYSVAIGLSAGATNQGSEAVAIGPQVAGNSQGNYAVAIGSGNAGNNQGTGSIAVGRGSGISSGNYAVAIGWEAGAEDTTALGDYAIAIGYRAGYDHGVTNSIVLNASGSNLSADYAGLYINPVRYTATQDATEDGIMFYNQTTKEVRYSYVLDGGSF